MGSYRRRDRIERHTWRTGLSVTPAVAEAAALAICKRAPDHARDLLEMCGLIDPLGAPRVSVNICTPRPQALWKTTPS
jgi:hypothetical protein